MSGSQFVTDTAIRPGADGRYAASLEPRWNVGANPNGGYLLAVALRAMSHASGRPDPMSLTAHYLSPPEVGPAEVATEVVKAGRSLATVSARVLQATSGGTGERERIRVLGTFGDLAAQTGPTNIGARPPELPDPDACTPLIEVTRSAGREPPEAVKRYDIRLPSESPWGRTELGEPYGIAGWIRFADGTEPDTASLVAFADAFPPTLIGSVDVGWVPTLELTVHVRARPAPGWMRASFRTRFLIDGVLEEDGELWDADGRPVAQSRQLALVLPPRRRQPVNGSDG